MASLVGLVIGDIDCCWLDVWNGVVKGGNIQKVAKGRNSFVKTCVMGYAGFLNIHCDLMHLLF